MPDQPPRSTPRVVSLVPSATEILCLIGGRDLLVGRSHECDFPAGLDSIPMLTGSRTGTDLTQPGSAAIIDQQVRSASETGQSLYSLDAAALAALRPDVILTQDLCSVCSIDADSVRSAIGGLDREPEVVALNPQTIEDILDDILRVGRATGLDREATQAVVALRERADRALEHVNPYTDGPIVGFMEWTDPVFVAGHWSVQLIERAGGRHPLNETVAKPGSGAAVGPQQAERVAGHSIAVSPEVFAAVKPAELVIAPCGLTLDQAIAQIEMLSDQEWFQGLPAVRDGRVAVVDGNQMFNRPGPRVFDALEFLVGRLNRVDHLIPDGFPWRAWSPQP